MARMIATLCLALLAVANHQVSAGQSLSPSTAYGAPFSGGVPLGGYSTGNNVHNNNYNNNLVRSSGYQNQNQYQVKQQAAPAVQQQRSYESYSTQSNSNNGYSRYAGQAQPAVHNNYRAAAPVQTYRAAAPAPVAQVQQYRVAQPVVQKQYGPSVQQTAQVYRAQPAQYQTQTFRAPAAPAPVARAQQQYYKPAVQQQYKPVVYQQPQQQQVSRNVQAVSYNSNYNNNYNNGGNRGNYARSFGGYQQQQQQQKPQFEIIRAQSVPVVQQSYRAAAPVQQYRAAQPAVQQQQYRAAAPVAQVQQYRAPAPVAQVQQYRAAQPAVQQQQYRAAQPTYKQSSSYSAPTVTFIRSSGSNGHQQQQPQQYQRQQTAARSYNFISNSNYASPVSSYSSGYNTVQNNVTPYGAGTSGGRFATHG